MKEAELKDQPIEIVAEAEQRKEIKFIGSIRAVKGLTIWEIDVKSGIIRPATFKKEDVQLTSMKVHEASGVNHKKVEVKQGCLYIQALNAKSALKKQLRLLRNANTQQAQG
jgi:hypothetical protein